MIITNDGATILAKLQGGHPCAKMRGELSKARMRGGMLEVLGEMPECPYEALASHFTKLSEVDASIKETADAEVQIAERAPVRVAVLARRHVAGVEAPVPVAPGCAVHYKSYDVQL